MQMGWSYIKDSVDFIKKTRNVGSVPENNILVRADVVGLHPSIPHDAELKALRELLDKTDQLTIPTSELIRMADFVLKNNYVEFYRQIKQQIFGTAIGTKFAPPYACFLWIKLKLLLLRPKSCSLWCGLDILKIFFYQDTW